MKELNTKYVFHIPLYKYKDEELISIDIDEIIGELIEEFNSKGHDSLYMTKVESYYKSRHFDELLITLFASESDEVESIFKQWFLKNKDILEQEAFAYECNNSMFIEEI